MNTLGFFYRSSSDTNLVIKADFNGRHVSVGSRGLYLFGTITVTKVSY